jgi:hypothetical protein
VSPGRYLIVERAFWTNWQSKVLVVKNVNYEDGYVIYKYESDLFCEVDRKRCFNDFFHTGLTIVPMTRLMEELT